MYATMHHGHAITRPLLAHTTAQTVPLWEDMANYGSIGGLCNWIHIPVACVERTSQTLLNTTPLRMVHDWYNGHQRQLTEPLVSGTHQSIPIYHSTGLASFTGSIATMKIMP